MGRFNKKILLTVILLGIFLLTGCNKFRVDTFNESDEGKAIEISADPINNQNGDKENIVQAKKAADNSDVTVSPAANNSVETGNSDTSGNTPTTVIQPNDNKDLSVYTVNADSGEIEPVTALVPKGTVITAELIVNKVLEAFEDQSIIVETDSVTCEGDAIIVSFVKDKAPYTNMGSGYESAILDAIAQSLIENMDSYNSVIYRIEGEAYKSGAYETEIDEPYFTR